MNSSTKSSPSTACTIKTIRSARPCRSRPHRRCRHFPQKWAACTHQSSLQLFHSINTQSTYISITTQNIKIMILIDIDVISVRLTWSWMCPHLIPFESEDQHTTHHLLATSYVTTCLLLYIMDTTLSKWRGALFKGHVSYSLSYLFILRKNVHLKCLLFYFYNFKLLSSSYPQQQVWIM